MIIYPTVVSDELSYPEYPDLIFFVRTYAVQERNQAAFSRTGYNNNQEQARWI
jgi:hypothetical protein